MSRSALQSRNYGTPKDHSQKEANAQHQNELGGGGEGLKRKRFPLVKVSLCVAMPEADSSSTKI